MEASCTASTDARYQAEDLLVVLLHTNLVQVQPSSQKCAGLARERASTSALGDLVLPHLGRNGGVVVIMTLCEKLPLS